MFTDNVLYWSAFKHNKEADNWLYQTSTGLVLQWRALIDNKEDDSVEDVYCKRAALAHIYGNKETANEL